MDFILTQTLIYILLSQEGLFARLRGYDFRCCEAPFLATKNLGNKVTNIPSSALLWPGLLS